KIEVAPGNGFEPITTNGNPELIALTHNETSSGVAMPLAYMAEVRRQFPNSLIMVDAVSSVPYPAFNFDHIDSVFFSVQKGFGMPAGLGVWIYNNRCVEKAKEVQGAGVNSGSYHNLLSLHEFTLKNQTPATPNMMAIYTLGYVAEDFLNRGIHIIRKETEYKAALLYQTLQQQGGIQPFVRDTVWRSPTVIVAHCGEHTEIVRKQLEAQGLYPGDGYGELKNTQLRFANFPAHSKEQYELLADVLRGMR
ncbi:MAG: aminotransferase class V-fold PLP-dependent enzyme, partial [Cytophagales bacterium]